jgi:hypothetical protein
VPPWDTIVRETKDGQEVRGTYLRAFIKNAGIYFLTEIQVFEDGRIWCWELVDFDGFRQKVAQGWVRTTLPEDATVSIFPLAHFKAREVRSPVREEEFVKQVADEIERLNGRPTTSDLCRAAYKRWRAEKTEDARAALRTAYEAVPEHLRIYVLGDMDRNDGPIRLAVYGDPDTPEYRALFEEDEAEYGDGEDDAAAGQIGT